MPTIPAINPDHIKKSQARRILKLLEQETRAEIMARHGLISSGGYGKYFQMKLDKLDELRAYVFGTSDLVELGYRWGLPVGKKKKKRKK